MRMLRSNAKSIVASILSEAIPPGFRKFTRNDYLGFDASPLANGDGPFISEIAAQRSDDDSDMDYGAMIVSGDENDLGKAQLSFEVVLADGSTYSWVMGGIDIDSPTIRQASATVKRLSILRSYKPSEVNKILAGFDQIQ